MAPSIRLYLTSICLPRLLVLGVAISFLATPVAAKAQQETIDIYLLAGQSNMQGIGQLAELPEEWRSAYEGVYFWNESGFEILNPAITKLSTRAGDFGPELGFAHRLKEDGLKRDIYLIKFHRSGQPLHFSLSGNKKVGEMPGPGRANFYPGESAEDENVGKHYVAWLKQCQAAFAALEKTGKIMKVRGVFWMQGEADGKSKQSAEEYAKSLSQLRERLGSDLGIKDLPWVYGQVLPHEPTAKRFTHRTEVREQMAALDARSGKPEATPGMRMVSTDGFPLKKDNVHYNADGQRMLGIAFAEAILELQLNTSVDFAPTPLADSWDFIGASINEPGYHVWGSSPILDAKGQVHLFAARWPIAAGFVPGWHTACEIAHYVGPTAEGPFKFVDVVVRGDGEGWNAQGIHNPHIAKVGNRYVLTFIGNTGEDFPASQSIGMFVADSLDGPWASANGKADMPMLAPPTDPKIWCFESGVGVNNPSLFAHPDGRILLYFKSKSGGKGKVKMGVAVADSLQGPYVIQENPITANDRTIEDGYAFAWRNHICLLTTDNHGMIENGGGLLWISKNGTQFDPQPVKGFHNFGSHYFPDGIPKAARPHYTKKVKFERPQLLMKDGEPFYLYVPCGVAIDGSDGTNNYILKYRKSSTALTSRTGGKL